jgi:hypothetical protein
MENRICGAPSRLTARREAPLLIRVFLDYEICIKAKMPEVIRLAPQ